MDCNRQMLKSFRSKKNWRKYGWKRRKFRRKSECSMEFSFSFGEGSISHKEDEINRQAEMTTPKSRFANSPPVYWFVLPTSWSLCHLHSPCSCWSFHAVRSSTLPSSFRPSSARFPKMLTRVRCFDASDCLIIQSRGFHLNIKNSIFQLRG